MTEELLPGARVPSIDLDPQRAARYVDQMRRVLRAARLNAFYPESRALASHIEVMDPAVHQGLYEHLAVDVRTGLPTYREWTRVQTDVTIAANQLHQLGPRGALATKAADNPDSIWAKQLKKHDYYTAIADHALAPLGEMNVALRRVDRKAGRASFHVELDKLDAMGVFVRYTIDLEQLGHIGGSSFEIDDREIAKQSKEFESLIYKFTSLDAEFTFVKLATLGALKPERVQKGTVGPIWFDFCRVPDVLQPLVRDGGFVASFSLDSAAIDIADERNNDPFATLAEDRLTHDSRAAYRDVKHRSGYKVFKDRKFVVPRDRVDELRAICDARGTRNIIYGV